MSLPLILIAAVARNGVIGANGGLPWKLSSDLRRFKADTMGRPIVMGRKTWESIGRPLPGRANIVVTRDPDFRAQGTTVANGIDKALTVANAKAVTLSPGDAVCVIGGGQLYKETIDRADKLFITHVEAEVEGDTHFPEIDPEIWQCVSEETFPAGEKDSHSTRYCNYQRKRTG